MLPQLFKVQLNISKKKGKSVCYDVVLTLSDPNRIL